MWIIGTDGIYSVVAHKDDPDQLLVRSRSEKDIDYFKSIMDELGLEPLSSKVYGDKFDYPWRYYCQKDDVTTAFAKIMSDIEYANFKSAAPSERGSMLMSIYYDIMRIDDRKKASGIGHAVSSPKLSYPYAPIEELSSEDPAQTEEEKQLLAQVLELEYALENIAYVAEGKGPPKTRRGKLRLIDALVRKGLWNEDPADHKLQGQVEDVEEDMGGE